MENKKLDDRLKEILKILYIISQGLDRISVFENASLQGQRSAAADSIYYILAILVFTILAQVGIALLPYSKYAFYMIIGLSIGLFIMASIQLFISHRARKIEKETIDDELARLHKTNDLTIKIIEKLDAEKD